MGPYQDDIQSLMPSASRIVVYACVELRESIESAKYLRDEVEK